MFQSGEYNQKNFFFSFLNETWEREREQIGHIFTIANTECDRRFIVCSSSQKERDRRRRREREVGNWFPSRWNSIPSCQCSPININMAWNSWALLYNLYSRGWKPNDNLHALQLNRHPLYYVCIRVFPLLYVFVPAFSGPLFFPRSEGASNYNPGAIPHLFPSARGSSASNLHVQKRNEKKKSHPRLSHDTKCSNDRKTASRTCTTVESDLDLKKWNCNWTQNDS